MLASELLFPIPNIFNNISRIFELQPLISAEVGLLREHRAEASVENNEYYFN
jgi:hypothetical protein